MNPFLKKWLDDVSALFAVGNQDVPNIGYADIGYAPTSNYDGLGLVTGPVTITDTKSADIASGDSWNTPFGYGGESSDDRTTQSDVLSTSTNGLYASDASTTTDQTTNWFGSNDFYLSANDTRTTTSNESTLLDGNNVDISSYNDIGTQDLLFEQGPGWSLSSEQDTTQGRSVSLDLSPLGTSSDVDQFGSTFEQSVFTGQGFSDTETASTAFNLDRWQSTYAGTVVSGLDLSQNTSTVDQVTSGGNTVAYGSTSSINISIEQLRSAMTGSYSYFENDSTSAFTDLSTPGASSSSWMTSSHSEQLTISSGVDPYVGMKG